jgi:hypothetical protein
MPSHFPQVKNGSPRSSQIHHYVFFGMDRERIREKTFLDTSRLVGAQLKYTWRELEPKPDTYDFQGIHQDLIFLRTRKKRLFLQLQDTSFAPSLLCVPQYLKDDPRYHGGADKQYAINGDDERNAVPEGWVARRWDPAVQERFYKLLSALGKEFDGQIEGINLPETSVDFGESGRLFPKGFTPVVYRDAILANMAVLKRAFPRSVTMQYANFMPGEWLPEQDRQYLRSIYQGALRLKVGVGGPDLLPYKKGQMDHSYPLLRSMQGRIPTGIAVQDGNYGSVPPKTGRPLTIPELLQFATDYLHVDYIFWCTEEPYYSQKLLPFLNRAA